MKKRGKILVSGSVVLDTILEKEFFGGTGANISYGLGKLKTSPMLFSLAGSDFKKDFGVHLRKSGVDLRIHIDKKGKTANFVCATNKKEEQIGVWKPNAYKNINKISLIKTISKGELRQVSIAIFSPGTPESIIKHLSEFKNYTKDAITIFDPGQMITFYSKKQLMDCIKLADIFIVNEMEYKQAKKILGKDPRKNIKKIIIETRGKKGSIVFDSKKITKVPIVHPKRIVDTTGAGDMFAGGILYGISKGLDLQVAGTIGSFYAAKVVERIGARHDSIDIKELKKLIKDVN